MKWGHGDRLVHVTKHTSCRREREMKGTGGNSVVCRRNASRTLHSVGLTTHLYVSRPKQKQPIVQSQIL